MADNYSLPVDEVEFPRISAARVTKHDNNLKLVPTKDVVFLLGESCCGQKKDGPQVAPGMIITEKYLTTIQELGWTPSIVRCPQIFCATPPEIETHLHSPFSVAATVDRVADEVEKVHKEGKFPMLVGGDHCLALGSVLGSSRRYPNLRVIWFDAHADINTPDTSPSGNMHGMPLAGLLGLMKPPGFEDGRYVCVTPDRLGYIGLRDVDAGERVILKDMGVDIAFDMDDLQKSGITELTHRILQKINPNNEFPIHLSFDVDGMDPMDAPSTGTPVCRGVRLHEAMDMIKIIRDTGCLVSMDCVEVNPSLGTHNEVALTIANARVVMANALSNA
eukprot:TRINITY_DN15637_c0_g1_i7.p1 TRINITY_DN15637_c0_g1~~TRINITY_DN15637_c0_g1_i7.p1  ORF type:complete len:333 (+),score=86.65 TRINITY_DN15637_c0_g1_i7:191-1189(+)